MTKNKKYKISRLYALASRYANSETLINEEEIFKDDITEEVLYELEQMIKEGEIIILNINAKPRMGKSTSGMALAKKIFDIMKKHNKIHKGATFGNKNIARDQQEFNQLMRNPEMEYTVILTDEINALENTGLNVTAEKALETTVSDVQAVRQVHRICCSPRDITDQNSDILLQIVSKRPTDYTTLAKVYYRIQEKGIETTQLIGHMIIDCKEIVKTWEDKVKKHYYKPERTEHDKQIVEEYRKKDFYTEYAIKKNEKIELITKEGIFRPRELIEAEVKLEIINKHLPFTKFMKIPKNRLEAAIKTECKKRKMPLSLITPYELAKDIEPILATRHEWHNIRNKGKILKNEWQTKPKMKDEAYKRKIQELYEYEKMLSEDYRTMKEDIEHLVRIKKKYDTYEETK